MGKDMRDSFIDISLKIEGNQMECPVFIDKRIHNWDEATRMAAIKTLTHVFVKCLESVLLLRPIPINNVPKEGK